MAHDSPPIAAVATAARDLRLGRRLTLDQVAEETGVSKGHLSRFERGQKALSVAALMRLSKALGVPVSALLGETQPGDVPHLVRHDARTTSKVATKEGGYRFALLSRAASEEGAAVFLLQLHSGLTMDGSVHADHDGHEGLFVVSGEIAVDIAQRTYEMGAGDYLEFPGRSLHFVRSLSSESEILVIVSRRAGKPVATRR